VGVVAVSAVERFAGSDDEGLDEIASLGGMSERESYQNKKGKGHGRARR
jgi:hypothetical protein